MSKTLITADEVKQALGIDSFRNLSKDKIMEFVSLIPSMDKDVALSIINQFPAYVEYAGQMVATLKEICGTILEKADESQKATIESYQKILDSLSVILQKEDITAEEREQIANKMIEVADKIALVNSEHKEFLLNILKCTGPVLIGALVLGATILGVSIKGTKIPTLPKK